MLEIEEPVNVWVYFKGNSIQPHLFFWRERRIKIDKINLIHTSRDGGSLFYYFSVSSEGNFYKLRFDTNKLEWMLEAVEEG